MDVEQQLRQLEARLALLEQERAELIFAINQLRNAPMKETESAVGRPILASPPITPKDKIELFLKLFQFALIRIFFL